MWLRECSLSIHLAPDLYVSGTRILKFAARCSNEVFVFLFDRAEYLSLPVQAIECKLANVTPAGKLCSCVDMHYVPGFLTVILLCKK